MKSRLTLPQPESMSDAQRAIHGEIMRSRGNVSGPFLAWLLSPGLAQPAQQLGAFCRYGTSLTLQESELLILLVAAHYACAAEQQIHEPIARRAGLPSAAIDDIRAGRPAALDTPRSRLLAHVARELIETKRLSDPSYADAVAVLGEPTLVEVVGLIGYYAFVAYTLNAFEMEP